MATRRVYEVTTEGGKFPWRNLEDALWHIFMMSKWVKRTGKRERITLKSYLTDKE